MTESSTFNRDQLDWRVSSLVAAGACAAIRLLECAKDYVMLGFRGPSVAPVRPAQRSAVVGPVDAPHARGHLAWPALPVRRRTMAPSHSDPPHALGHPLDRPHRRVRCRVLLGRRSDDVGATSAKTIQVFIARYLATDVVIYAAAVRGLLRVRVLRAFGGSRSRRRQAEGARRDCAQPRRGAHPRASHGAQPHFLFNALNAASGLVRKRENDAAVDMLARLGDLLRTTLDRGMPAEVALSEEINYLGRFVDIELVRFRDRLRVTWDIEADVRNALVPPLILQPLVENAATRHRASPGPAQLRIAARHVSGCISSSRFATPERAWCPMADRRVRGSVSQHASAARGAVRSRSGVARGRRCSWRRSSRAAPPAFPHDSSGARCHRCF